MPAKRFTVRANIPVLGENAHQEFDIMAGSWTVALGKAARLLRKLPVMNRRRVAALSIVLEQREGSTIPSDPSTPPPADILRFPKEGQQGQSTVESIDDPSEAQ
jgi:hypothetical protein